MGKGNPNKARFIGAGGDADGGNDQDFRPFSDGMTDVSYHTPAWHQARIDSLLKPRVSYEEWKLKAKEAEGKLAAAADEEQANMREYRAQLEADRAARMGKGAAADKDEKKKSKKSSKDKKSKKKKSSKEASKKSSKRKKGSKDKKKRRRDDSSSGSSSSESSSSDSSDSDSDPGRGPSKKSKLDDPVRLSEFLKPMK